MASDQSFVDYVCEQVGLGARLTSRRMFGEYALYVDGKVVAFVCDNHVFLKPTEPARALLPGVGEGPPYPGAKLYLQLGDELDDRELMRRVFNASAEVLPLSKPKAPKGRAKQIQGRT